MSSLFNRGLSDEHFARFQQDFGFLFEQILNGGRELDLRLRDGYFNLYHCGNNLAKVSFKSSGYKVEIHRKFCDGVFDPIKFKQHRTGRNYLAYNLVSVQLPRFLSRKNVKSLVSRIRELNYCEEMAFEQKLISSNAERKDFVLIDRQVTGGKLGRSEIDLLGLLQSPNSSGHFQFVVLELKLAHNSDLGDKVVKQLGKYASLLEKDFDQFRSRYCRVYSQLKTVGLFQKPDFSEIEIVRPVIGGVVVGGYSSLSDEKICRLKAKYPDLPFLRLQPPKR